MIKKEESLRKKYEPFIISLLAEINSRRAFNTIALKMGKHSLIGIKTVVNSTYSTSSILKMLYENYPQVRNEIAKQLMDTGKQIPDKNQILFSVKNHEYHVLTEEMNVTMSLLIDFNKMRKQKKKSENKDSMDSPILWNEKLSILEKISKENLFIKYLKEEKELRNAIAHCTIWLEGEWVYYYPGTIGSREPKKMLYKTFLEKTRELNILVLLFFEIFVKKKKKILNAVR